jgi:hypothetical protein
MAEREPTTAADNHATPGRVDHSIVHSDGIEAALAQALDAAAAAGRFDVVAQLAKELEARRLAQTNVVRLYPKRREEG